MVLIHSRQDECKRNFRRIATWVVAGSCLALATAGCSLSAGSDRPVGVPVSASFGKGSDILLTQTDLEAKSVELLQAKVGVRPDNVKCEGAIPKKQGATQRCIVVKNGTSIGMTAKVASLDGDEYRLEVEVDEK